MELRDKDFVGEYRKISNKLKKSIILTSLASLIDTQNNKVLVDKLGKCLVQDDEPEYAGMCGLAVARCEASIGNAEGEIEALIEAARDFMEAEKKVVSLGNHSFQYHLLASIDCYGQAIRSLEESQSPGNSSRAAGLCRELGDALVEMGKVGQALSYYERAAELRNYPSTILESVRTREKIAKCYADTEDYHKALSVLTKISDSLEAHCGDKKPPTSVYFDILRSAEITRVLLLLLIKPTPQNLSPNLTLILEKYAWDTPEEKRAEIRVSEEVFLLLQSVVMAAQVNDGEAIVELEDDLVPYLDNGQKKLLRRLAARERGRLS